MDKEGLEDFKLIRCIGFIRIILKPLPPVSAYIGNTSTSLSTIGALGVRALLLSSSPSSLTTRRNMNFGSFVLGKGTKCRSKLYGDMLKIYRLKSIR